SSQPQGSLASAYSTKATRVSDSSQRTDHEALTLALRHLLEAVSIDNDALQLIRLVRWRTVTNVLFDGRTTKIHNRTHLGRQAAHLASFTSLIAGAIAEAKTAGLEWKRDISDGRISPIYGGKHARHIEDRFRRHSGFGTPRGSCGAASHFRSGQPLPRGYAGFVQQGTRRGSRLDCQLARKPGFFARSCKFPPSI